MTILARIIEDPERPEGGHALLLLSGLEPPPGPTRIAFASLTDGFDYAGPREIMAQGHRDGEETVFALGPEIVGAMPPGVAVQVALPDLGDEIEMRWPTLTPPRAAPKRRPVRQLPQRIVVETVSTAKAPRFARRPEPGDAVKPADAPEVAQTAAEVGKPGGENLDGQTQAPCAAAKPQTTLSQPPLTLLQSQQPQPEAPKLDPKRTSKPGIGLVAASVAWVAAFVLGGAAGYFVAPKTTLVAEPPKTIAAPTLYDTLERLPDRSPKGVTAPASDIRTLVLRGKDESDDAERTFWFESAARTMLRNKENGVASTLSELGSGLANVRPPAHDLSAARTLWELGAVADDCAAMDNIAISLSGAPNALANQEADTWRERARACRSNQRK